MLDALKSRLDARRYYLLGHSLGGQLCALHLARAAAERTSAPDNGPAGLILVACGLPYWRTYRTRRGRLAVLVFTQAIVAATAATIGSGRRPARFASATMPSSSSGHTR